jgi:acyl carrier protein
MPDLKPRLIAILQKYVRDPNAKVGGSTLLSDVEIDLLDLSMICLDLEDAFDVQMGHGDELKGLATVDDLVARVASGLAAKALPRVRIPRPKRTGCRRAPSPDRDPVGSGARDRLRITHRHNPTVHCVGTAAMRSATSFLANWAPKV